MIEMKWYRTTVTTPQRRYPQSNTGIYLYTHTHDWREIGTKTWPNGSTSIVFRCSKCSDVISSDNPRSTPPTI